MLSVRKEEKSTGRLHKDGGIAVNVVMKSECCPLDRKRSLLVRPHKDGDVAVNVVMKSECCPLDRKRSLLVVSTRMVVLL